MRKGNKKYWFLDNLTWLFEELKMKSMMELAKELCLLHNIPDPRSLAGSIRFMVKKYFTEDQIKQLKKERIFHTNKPRSV